MRVVGSFIGARRGRLGLLAVSIALTALLSASASRRCNRPRQGHRRLELERGDQLDQGRARGLPLRLRQGDGGHGLHRQDLHHEPERERGRRPRLRRLPLRTAGRQEPGRRDRERDQAGQPLPRRRGAAAGRAAAGARPRGDRQPGEEAPAGLESRLARPDRGPHRRRAVPLHLAALLEGAARRLDGRCSRRHRALDRALDVQGLAARARTGTGTATAGGSGSGRTASPCRGSSTAPTATG